MSNKKAVKKVKKRNPNLRLVKNDDIKPESGKSGQKEKVRFDKTKRRMILSAVLLSILKGPVLSTKHKYQALESNQVSSYRAGIAPNSF